MRPKDPGSLRLSWTITSTWWSRGGWGASWLRGFPSATTSSLRNRISVSRTAEQEVEFPITSFSSFLEETFHSELWGCKLELLAKKRVESVEEFATLLFKDARFDFDDENLPFMLAFLGELEIDWSSMLESSLLLSGKKI